MASSFPQNDRYYIARHKLNHTFEAHDMDYVVGRFDPSLSLGRIVVSAGNTEKVRFLLDESFKIIIIIMKLFTVI